MTADLMIKNKLFSFPLIQGGMGVGISLSSLAGNVMKQGCMGVLSAAQPGYRKPNFKSDTVKANCEAILEHAQMAREIAGGKGLLGINIMVASENYAEYVKTAVKAKVDAIISGAGLPLDLPKYCTDKSILLAPIVSSAKAASLICRAWDKRHQTVPDFIVIEGSEAGGHLGFKEQDLLDGNCQPLEVILAEVKEELHVFQEKYDRVIPVFVAGGIYNGSDIARFLKLGASGVQMGTRFIATHECDADIRFKQAVVEATIDDIAIVKSPTGFAGRGLMNDYMKSTRGRENVKIKGCLNCLKPCNPVSTPYCISDALMQAANGNVDHGLVFVGSNAYKINGIISVEQLINELKTETFSNLK